MPREMQKNFADNTVSNEPRWGWRRGIAAMLLLGGTSGAAVLAALVHHCSIAATGVVASSAANVHGHDLGLAEGDTGNHHWLRRLRSTLTGVPTSSQVPSSSSPTSDSDCENKAGHLGFFFRTIDRLEESVEVHLQARDVGQLKGVSNLRVLPGVFHNSIPYHFDGLSTLVQFNFSHDRLSYQAKPYKSSAFEDFGSCVYVATGTGPTLGTQMCLTNPGVNLLPIDDQLWLTVDTVKWGQMQPGSLETLPGKVQVPSTVLNAHPACDQRKRECFVQYNCAPSSQPYTDQACIGLLRTGQGDMQVEEVSRVTLPSRKLIQHSHSPCITPNYVVSKLDAFVGRNPLNENFGILKFLHQGEDKLWMVMDRRTNSSRLLSSNASFVNNHFWNCFELEGSIVVDAVAATQDYLDYYFDRNLDKAQGDWKKLFHQPVRCRVPTSGNWSSGIISSSDIACEPLFLGSDAPLFDYPTYNPLFKMNPKYQFFYAIAFQSAESRFFDELIKVDIQSRKVVQRWSSPGLYVTEADFIPSTRAAPGSGPGTAAEDDGMLAVIMYNSSSDTSSFVLFDAKGLTLRSMYKLSFVVPFSAHGIICDSAVGCYSNP